MFVIFVASKTARFSGLKNDIKLNVIASTNTINQIHTNRNF